VTTWRKSGSNGPTKRLEFCRWLLETRFNGAEGKAFFLSLSWFPLLDYSSADSTALLGALHRLVIIGQGSVINRRYTAGIPKVI